MNRALRAATMGALLLSPIALTACSAGQVAQTATQNRDKVGPQAAVGDVELRAITLAYPPDGLYEEGEDAELEMAVVNTDNEPDRLVSIEGEAFEGVLVSGQATPVPAVPGSPSAEPVAASPSAPEPAPTDPAATPSPGALPSSSAPATPTASSTVDIPLPAQSTVFLGGDSGATVQLVGLTEELTAGQSIEATLTFERAGEITVQALVGTPTRVVPREEPFDFHHEEGEESGTDGAEDVAREREAEAGGGDGD
ncbi:copper chaperone PCu(A)C [Geodermatophilus sp. DSM 44513]|uniref:copper chaperone PCu(A)C n=1 Tax=Geodermatophilus sp. DSM 44513 TaxID=1528104 RepID=UPI0012848D6C|nr:copper chaperone PCu(A)C [Geodermatophilus sp. DSM 44513]WNV76263.1 copper chaperone PCu(A)C [Geodermatophilus sp. DSM 44513]